MPLIHFAFLRRFHMPVQPPGVGPRLAAAIPLCLGLSLFATGCERQLSGGDPPLRPLVYTELPPAEELPDAAPTEAMMHVAPEDLGYALFHALIDHDRTSFEALFIRAQALSDLIHTPIDDAQKQTSGILKKSEKVWTLFSPSVQYEEPMGGLSTRLRLSEFRLGKGRNLAGKIAQPEQDELMQHWGNELRIELIGSDKVFTIRVPKIVKTPAGWRIAQPVELDKTLQIFLECGMHLKSGLLSSEHYPMPLEVGNFWKYRIERDDIPSAQGATDTPVASATLTDMITDIAHREGYWVVSFERTLVDPSKQAPEDTETTTFSWLATPRMIYPCKRDCKNNLNNIGYLLGYIMRQTPIFRFPLEVGNKWSVAGQKDVYSRYEVRALHTDPIVVPEGSFTGVYEIFGSIEEGRESRFFMPGIGTVQRTVRSGAGSKREVLLNHRLIL